MKYFSSFRMPLLLIVAGAALFFAPACKAQSEVSPDHFDGTDSWAAAAQTPRQAKHKQTVAKSGLQAQTQRNAQASGFQLASSREASKPAPKQAAAANRKRKPATSDPEKK
ncbi:MAG TPA: hypothetical protein VEI73_17190 [Candidatus Acidoferrum sp.]|nr:hypothetical protein [Candidatus Acidoferrum sp.]